MVKGNVMTVQRWFRTLTLCAAALLPAVCLAQELPPSLEPLRHGPLTIWFIVPPSPLPVPIASNYLIKRPTPTTYQEQTAGTFGQSASTFGQNSGSYGLPSDTSAISTRKAAQGENAPDPGADGIGYREQTSGSFGQTSSSYGSVSSDHGQTAGSFGQTAGSTGINAGNYGQTASSLGSGRAAGDKAASRSSSVVQNSIASFLPQPFPDLQVKFLDVAADELQDRLTAAEGTAEYPDMLAGPLPDTWGNDARGQFLLDTIQPAAIYKDGLPESVLDNLATFAQLSILARAPHREAARALALWTSEWPSVCAGCQQDDQVRRQPYVTVALSAMNRLLRGTALGELGDAEMATFPPPLGRLILTTSANTPVQDGAARVDVLKASVDGGWRSGRLAAVSVRVVASSDTVFGLAYPLVILRKREDGQWKVLHVSLNLPAAQEEKIRLALMSTRPTSVAETRAGVLGVHLATPQDGDTRPSAPVLSWDNGGGAGLQVVEWQTNMQENGPDAWSDARLYLVRDTGARLKTEVTAGFAIHQARYRWRVWSVGAAGETKISPWRTINVVP
jgi:hypothetical protein